MDKGIRAIMDVEEKAEDILQKARKKADKIREDSQKDLFDLRTRLEHELSERKEKKIMAAEKSIKKTREDMIKRNDVETQIVLEKSRKNTKEAVDYVMEILRMGG